MINVDIVPIIIMIKILIMYALIQRLKKSPKFKLETPNKVSALYRTLHRQNNTGRNTATAICMVMGINQLSSNA
jgi:hypothetical protein